MLDITAIILTYNEEVHIARCLDNVAQVAQRVVVIDSGSTDSTVDIASATGAEVVSHEWPGSQATQFNWALDTLSITTEWVLRLDADEYLLPELVEELHQRLPGMPKDVFSLSLSRARSFMGRRLRHGVTGDVEIVRIFRTGRARYEQRLMDEHLSIDPCGRVERMKGQFIDDNLLPIGQFIAKHNGYASREAALLLDAELGLSGMSSDTNHGSAVEKKRAKKARYARMPLFWRAFGYFVYRYILRFGFLDGTEGFLWDFMQGFWYRTLVDAKVYEVKKECGTDRDKILAYLHDHYGIMLTNINTGGGN